jgi:hypothetical protein
MQDLAELCPESIQRTNAKLADGDGQRNVKSPVQEGVDESILNARMWRIASLSWPAGARG